MWTLSHVSRGLRGFYEGRETRWVLAEKTIVSLAAIFCHNPGDCCSCLRAWLGLEGWPPPSSRVSGQKQRSRRAAKTSS